MTFAQVLLEVVHRYARINYILYHNHILVADIRLQRHGFNHAPCRVGSLVRLQAYGSHRAIKGQRAHQIGQKEHCAVQHADEHRLLAGIIAGNLLRHILNKLRYLLRRDIFIEDHSFVGNRVIYHLVIYDLVIYHLSFSVSS